MLYRLLLAIDGLAALAALGFFVIGLINGGTGTQTLSSWLILLAGFGAIIGGGIALHRRGNHTGANAILLILAAPALSVAIMLLLTLPHAPAIPSRN